jgi:hypothetical protein
MIQHDIGELGTIISFKPDISLAQFMCLREILAHLHGNLCEDGGFHASLEGLPVE